MYLTKNASLTVVIIFGLLSCSPRKSQETNELKKVTEKTLDVIAYYSGSKEDIRKYSIEQLDQIIYSFLHLDGNQLAIDDEADSLTLLEITSLKKEYPKLKVLVSLGGWGGCETCSVVFETEENRKIFANSLLRILRDYDADGIDLDWEYPAIKGYPGHIYKPEDKSNFTALIQELRKTLGSKYEISFAAGGFSKFLKESVEWGKIMPLLDRVNVMTYDLIHGYSTETGHHTGLFSNPKQRETTENAIQYLDSIGVPLEKVVIGAAFYARIWENVENTDNGLYQSGKFLRSIHYKNLEESLSEKNGFITYWDSVSQAPFAYNQKLKQFATYDNPESIVAKVKYAKEKGLGGIMFWELRNDKEQNGLLDVLYKEVNN